MRKIASLLLSVIILASFAVLPVGAAGSVTPIQPDGTGINWRFDSIKKSLYVDGEGVIPDYALVEGEEDPRPWAEHADQIENIVISDGVTAIGDNAFAFTAAVKVELPATLTEVGDCAFRGTKLAEVELPRGVVSIGVRAFAGAPIVRLILPETVLSIGEAAFSDCEKLTGVMLPSGVTEIAELAFAGCESLQFVTLPGGLEKIGDQAFDGCKALSAVSIPDGVTGIGHGAFCCCSALTELRLPASLTFIGQSAFADSGLKRLILPDSAVGLSGGTFAGLTTLEELYISDNNTNYVIEDDLLLSYDKSVFITSLKGVELTTLTLPESVTELSEGAFMESYLLSVILPDGLKKIGDYAFYMSGITSLRVPAGVESIGAHAFAECASLGSLLVAGKDTQVDEKAFYSSKGSVYAWADSSMYDALVAAKETDRFIPIDNELGYLDVNTTMWSYAGIEHAVTNDLFRGMSTMYFMPEVKMNRAMLVTVLHRLAGETEASEDYELPFTDVTRDAYYYEALRWAAENGIITGTSATTFSPNDYITREQLVTVLYRYVVGEEAAETEVNMDSFADADYISDYAVPAMKWAVANGIIEGMNSAEGLAINPKGEATRAQVATVFMRLDAEEEPPVEEETPVEEESPVE